MAGILEQRFRAEGQRNPHGPGRRPHGGVRNRDFPVEGLRAHPREPLHHPETVGRTAETGGRRKVRGLHHQRVTLPVPPRVAVQLAHIITQVLLAGERDDASVVVHLVHDDHMVRALEDLVVAVIAGAEPRHAIRHTALRQRAVRIGIGRMVEPVLGGRAQLLAGLWRHVRHPPVRRVDDQRRLSGEVTIGDPELVVVTGRRIIRGRLDTLDGRQHELIAEQRVAIANRVGRRDLQGRHLLIGQLGLVRPGLWSFERRNVVVRPDALQIRMPVGCAGQGPIRIGLAGRRGRMCAPEHESRHETAYGPQCPAHSSISFTLLHASQISSRL